MLAELGNLPFPERSASSCFSLTVLLYIALAVNLANEDMNKAAAMNAKHIAATGLDDLLGLIGLSSQTRVKRIELSSSVSEMLKGISAFIDELLTRAIASQTEKEFESLRSELFDQYAKAVINQAALVRLLVR